MNPDNLILVYSTLGSGSHDEQRIVRLLVNFNIYLVSFDRSKKFSSAIKIIKEAKKHKPCLIIQEGSGFCGFFSLLFCKFVLGISFIVSSGDAIGPFLSAKYPFFYIIFHPLSVSCYFIFCIIAIIIFSWRSNKRTVC